MDHYKHRKNCECCPVSFLIFRSQRLSWIQVLNCQNWIIKSQRPQLSGIIRVTHTTVQWWDSALEIFVLIFVYYFFRFFWNICFTVVFDTRGSLIALAVPEIHCTRGFCDGRGRGRRNWVVVGLSKFSKIVTSCKKIKNCWNFQTFLKLSEL